MLERLRFKDKSMAVKVKIPKHIAITMDGISGKKGILKQMTIRRFSQDYLK